MCVLVLCIVVSVLDPYGLSVCVISPVKYGVYIYIHIQMQLCCFFKWTEDGKIE